MESTELALESLIEFLMDSPEETKNLEEESLCQRIMNVIMGALETIVYIMTCTKIDWRMSQNENKNGMTEYEILERDLSWDDTEAEKVYEDFFKWIQEAKG